MHKFYIVEDSKEPTGKLAKKNSRYRLDIKADAHCLLVLRFHSLEPVQWMHDACIGVLSSDFIEVFHLAERQVIDLKTIV